MRSTLIAAAALVLLKFSVLHAAEPSKDPAKNPDITKFSMEAMNAQSLAVGLLREGSCGSDPLADQDANNAAFAGCVMYVLGAVDMIREWQRLDPAHAPPACIPRSISAGGLTLAIQQHIETTAPWHRQQFDASTAVIAALTATWPCQRR
jgi:Rap1a immunity proteins